MEPLAVLTHFVVTWSLTAFSEVLMGSSMETVIEPVSALELPVAFDLEERKLGECGDTGSSSSVFVAAAVASVASVWGFSRKASRLEEVFDCEPICGQLPSRVAFVFVLVGVS